MEFLFILHYFSFLSVSVKQCKKITKECADMRGQEKSHTRFKTLGFIEIYVDLQIYKDLQIFDDYL